MTNRTLDEANPRPWKVANHDSWWSVTDSAGNEVFDDGSAGDEYSPACSPETRDLIISAVNAHDTLIRALQLIAKNTDGVQTFSGTICAEIATEALHAIEAAK